MDIQPVESCNTQLKFAPFGVFVTRLRPHFQETTKFSTTHNKCPAPLSTSIQHERSELVKTASFPAILTVARDSGRSPRNSTPES
jgi:hypothetical protein